MDAIFFKDLVENNGKTVYENNMNKSHKFNVGTKVYSEIKYITTAGPKFEKGIYTIFSLDRDCDGEPIYSLISESINVINGWKKFCHNIKEMVIRLGAFGYQSGILESSIMEIPQLKDNEYTEYMMKKIEKKYKKYIKVKK